MKLIGAVVLSLVALSGCVSAKEMRLSEPLRSQSFAFCMLRVGLPITICECVEKRILKQFDGDESKALSLGYGNELVLKPAIEACIEEFRQTPDFRKMTNGGEM